MNDVVRKLIGAVALAALLAVPTQAKAAILTLASDPINVHLKAPDGFQTLFGAGTLSGSLDKITVDLAAKVGSNNSERPNDLAILFLDTNQVAATGKSYVVTHYFSGVTTSDSNRTVNYRGLGPTGNLFDFTTNGGIVEKSWAVGTFDPLNQLDIGNDASDDSLASTLGFDAFDPSATMVVMGFGWAGSGAGLNSGGGVATNNANAFYGSTSYINGIGGSNNDTRSGSIILSGNDLAAGSGGAVPEPSACMLFVVAGVGGIATRRRRRR